MLSPCSVLSQSVGGGGAGSRQFDGYSDFSRTGQRPPKRTHLSIDASSHVAEHNTLLELDRTKWSKDTKGVIGRSALFDLPYFDIATMTVIDMMHIIPGVLSAHMLKVMVGKRLTGKLSAEKKRVAVANAKLEDAAEKDLALRNVRFQKEKAAWLSRTKAARSLPKTHPQRAARMAEIDNPPFPPVYTPCRPVVDRTEEIERMVEQWHIPLHCSEALEIHCWSQIRGPPGIAPWSKKPLTVPSTMNMSLWMGVAKVTGKYLLSHVIEGTILTLVCDIFDFMTACLAAQQTPESIVEIKAASRKIAGHIADYFPDSELSLVLHMLVMHIPDQLKTWGPARGWWVFAFERSVWCGVVWCQII